MELPKKQSPGFPLTLFSWGLYLLSQSFPTYLQKIPSPGLNHKHAQEPQRARLPALPWPAPNPKPILPLASRCSPRLPRQGPAAPAVRRARPGAPHPRPPPSASPPRPPVSWTPLRPDLPSRAAPPSPLPTGVLPVLGSGPTAAACTPRTRCSPAGRSAHSAPLRCPRGPPPPPPPHSPGCGQGFRAPTWPAPGLVACWEL